MKHYTYQDIQDHIDISSDLPGLLESQHRAFQDYSSGKMDVPLPLQLTFPETHGDCHVKGGFRRDGSMFVVKIATGFYENPKMNLSSGDGAVLVFSQKTGHLIATFYDQGYLTTLRTSLAALLASKLSPWQIKTIGILGSGRVAQECLSLLQHTHPTACLKLWARSEYKCELIAKKHEKITVSPNMNDLLSGSDLVITTTASQTPLIHPQKLKHRTHVIALGADEPGKQELNPRVFAQASHVLTDSLSQSSMFGEVYHGAQAGTLNLIDVRELGTVRKEDFSQDASLIITDLTGLAAQDYAVVEFILQKIEKHR